MDNILLIRETAHEIGIDPDLYQAVCAHESSNNPNAIRFEPAYRWVTKDYRDYADHLGISAATEYALQSMSYGLCQLMGSVFRELGYTGPLNAMDAKTCLKYGAIHLKSFLQKYGNEPDAISAWNQGSNRKTDGGMFQNQTYVDAVNQALTKLRALK